MTTTAAPSARHPVEELAEDFLTRYRRGERPSLSEYTQQFPEVADELSDIVQALLMLEGLGVEGELAGHSSPPLPERLGEYRLVREIGRGGMGIVYEAEQAELGRHVALKILPAVALLRPTHLERFRREARAAARLHHTNIIPVYGVGVQDGIHYYAMQFIPGRGLEAILRDLRKQRTEPLAETERSAITLLSGSNTTNTTEYHRAVARIGLQVAEALAHAHAHGILHRDVKPANIILDDQGISWLGDFGLAYLEGDAPLTGSGGFVGTLLYLAPERFKSEGDARSDIYSLGATLYELLTLRPMFEATDRARLIRQVTQDEPPPPRRINRAIPKDLETLVLKAIAKNPDDRYATCTALAEDLQRFIADRPVAARRVSRWELFRRWVRRNPLIAGLLTTIFLSLGIGLGATWWQWRRADDNRAVAQRESDLAWRAVRATLSGLGGTFAQPNVELRRSIYEEMLRLHQELAAESPPARRLDRAVIARGLAKAFIELGQQDRGIEAYRESLKLLEDLSHDSLDQLDVQQELGLTLNGLAEELTSRHAVEAESLARRAVGVYRGIAASDTTSADYQLGLSTALRTWASTLRRLKRPDTDLRNEAADILTKLNDEQPQSLKVTLALAKVRGENSRRYVENGQLKEALDAAKVSQKLADDLLGQWPDRCDVIQAAAQASDTLAVVYYTQDTNIPEALEASRRGANLYRALVRQDPDNPTYLHQMGGSLHNLAKYVGQHADPAEAHRLLDEAATSVRKARAINPMHPHYRDNAYRIHTARGLLYVFQKDHEGTARTAAEALSYKMPRGEEAVFAAKQLCYSALFAAHDEKLERAEGSRLARSYFDQAMKHLEIAVERGFNDTTSLQKSPLRALDYRADFKALVAVMKDKERSTSRPIVSRHEESK